MVGGDSVDVKIGQKNTEQRLDVTNRPIRLAILEAGCYLVAYLEYTNVSKKIVLFSILRLVHTKPNIVNNGEDIVLVIIKRGAAACSLARGLEFGPR